MRSVFDGRRGSVRDRWFPGSVFSGALPWSGASCVQPLLPFELLVRYRYHLDNLAAVATYYADAGVRRLVLATAVRSNAVFDALRAVVPFPLRVVRLTLAAR